MISNHPEILNLNYACSNVGRDKINFHKIEVLCLREAQERKYAIEKIFTCKSGALPMKYLGVPVD
jgi:hypothetical protein